MRGPLWKISILAALGLVTVSVAGLAVAIKTASPATASSGSLVNIADATNPADLAHVSSTGALSTSISGNVGTYPMYLRNPALNVSVTTGAFSGSQASAELIVPTQARIVITSITASSNVVGLYRVQIVDVSVPNGTPPGSCLTSATSSSVWEVFNLSLGQSDSNAILSPSLPIAFFPPTGQTQCLAVVETVSGSPSSNTVSVSATGYVASGTYTP